MNTSAPNTSAGEHPSVTEELRSMLESLAARAEPLLHKVGSGPATPHTPATCNWCPLCATLALLRGQRPELAVRAAEHAAGLLAVFRAALQEHQEQAKTAEHGPAGQTTADDGAAAPGSSDPGATAQAQRRNRVQKIALRKPGQPGFGGAGDPDDGRDQPR